MDSEVDVVVVEEVEVEGGARRVGGSGQARAREKRVLTARREVRRE